jgi:Xaa-Pro aminopeptidase
VYIPGRFGVRVEDTVAVFEDGPRRFNHAPRELQIVH